MLQGGKAMTDSTECNEQDCKECEKLQLLLDEANMAMYNHLRQYHPNSELVS